MVGINLLGAGDPSDVRDLALITVSQFCEESVARNNKNRGECFPAASQAPALSSPNPVAHSSIKNSFGTWSSL